MANQINSYQFVGLMLKGELAAQLNISRASEIRGREGVLVYLDFKDKPEVYFVQAYTPDGKIVSKSDMSKGLLKLLDTTTKVQVANSKEHPIIFFLKGKLISV